MGTIEQSANRISGSSVSDFIRVMAGVSNPSMDVILFNAPHGYFGFEREARQFQLGARSK